MTGVWIIQLGTPEAPTWAATKKYLDEFLMDPRMIELPYPLRLLLVKGLITPFRSKKSAKAYRTVWMEGGSPLLVHSQNLAKRLQAELGQSYSVQLGMRYGEPSIESSWKELKTQHLEKIVVVPLFPQYSSATTASVYDKVHEVLKKEHNYPALQFLPPFYNRPEFTDCFAQRAKDYNLHEFDHVLFSFHGLPERYVRRSSHICLEVKDCCETLGPSNRFCYRAHCVHTARQIQAKLQLPDDRVSISFQSRLGREKWLDPYTDIVVKELPKKGVKRLAVFSPSFVADCLETVEEIGVRARQDFLAAGGKELLLIPSLNDSSEWVLALGNWIRSEFS